jgi:AcrR family transcriptional regulator
VDRTEAARRLLDAAETLFYRRGVQTVGMDEVRAAAGVSLKQLYQCFPSKETLVVAYLERRDACWRAALSDYVDTHATDPRQRILAVFDWLRTWFAEESFRGCAFVNSYGELGATWTTVADAALAHKTRLRDYLVDLASTYPVDDAADPDLLADQLLVLIEGATTTAVFGHGPRAAAIAKATATALLSAPRRGR